MDWGRFYIVGLFWINGIITLFGIYGLFSGEKPFFFCYFNTKLNSLIPLFFELLTVGLAFMFYRKVK